MLELLKRLNVVFAERIWYATNHISRHEVNYTITALYRTWGGKYILVTQKPNWQQGKLHWLIFGNSKLAYPKVQPLTEAEAREWAISVHMDVDKFDVVFGVVTE